MGRKDEIVTEEALEDDAYHTIESIEREQARDYGDYSHIGGPLYERKYRPTVLKEWPMHTDFRPDELTLAEIGNR